MVWLYKATPHAGVPFVGEQRGGFRKALFRGLEGESSTLGAKGGLVGKGGDAGGQGAHTDLQADPVVD